MAEQDWTTLSSPALGTGEVPRGVTTMFTRPYGGGDYTFGFRSAGSDVGFAGYAVNLSNFSPTASGKGAIISCAMKKYHSPGTSYAPMIGLVQSLNPVTTAGYLLGLSEGTSYYYTCLKGAPADGLSVSSSAVLRSSSAAMTEIGNDVDDWHHLRMDVIVNPHNEVVLKFWKNVLTSANVPGVSGPVNDPEWTAIDGMEDYIDDSIGIMSGTTPLLGSFYAIFGHYTDNQPGAISLFDYFRVERQLNP